MLLSYNPLQRPRAPLRIGGGLGTKKRVRSDADEALSSSKIFTAVLSSRKQRCRTESSLVNANAMHISSAIALLLPQTKCMTKHYHQEPAPIPLALYSSSLPTTTPTIASLSYERWSIVPEPLHTQPLFHDDAPSLFSEFVVRDVMPHAKRWQSQALSRVFPLKRLLETAIRGHRERMHRCEQRNDNQVPPLPADDVVPHTATLLCSLNVDWSSSANVPAPFTSISNDDDFISSLYTDEVKRHRPQFLRSPLQNTFHAPNVSQLLSSSTSRSTSSCSTHFEVPPAIVSAVVTNEAITPCHLVALCYPSNTIAENEEIDDGVECLPPPITLMSRFRDSVQAYRWKSVAALVPTTLSHNAYSPLTVFLNLQSSAPRLHSCKPLDISHRPIGPTGMPVVTLSIPFTDAMTILPQRAHRITFSQKITETASSLVTQRCRDDRDLHLVASISLLTSRQRRQRSLNEDAPPTKEFSENLQCIAHATVTAALLAHVSYPPTMDADDDTFCFLLEDEFSARVRAEVEMPTQSFSNEAVDFLRNAEARVSSQMEIWVAQQDVDDWDDTFSVPSFACPRECSPSGVRTSMPSMPPTMQFVARALLSDNVDTVLVPWDRRYGGTTEWCVQLTECLSLEAATLCRGSQASACVHVYLWCGAAEKAHVEASVGGFQIAGRMSVLTCSHQQHGPERHASNSNTLDIHIVSDHGTKAWESFLSSEPPSSVTHSKSIVLDHSVQTCHFTARRRSSSGIVHVLLEDRHEWANCGSGGSPRDLLDSSFLADAHIRTVSVVEHLSQSTARHSQDWTESSWIERHTLQSVGDLVKTQFQSVASEGSLWAQELMACACHAIDAVARAAPTDLSLLWYQNLTSVTSSMCMIDGSSYSHDAVKAWTTSARRAASIVRGELLSFLESNSGVLKALPSFRNLTASLQLLMSKAQILTSEATSLELCDSICEAAVSDGVSFALEHAKMLGRRLSSSHDMAVLETATVRGIVGKLVTSVRASSADRGTPAHIARRQFLLSVCEQNRVHGALFVFADKQRAELFAKSLAASPHGSAPLGCWTVGRDSLSSLFQAVQPSVSDVTSVGGTLKCRLAVVLCNASIVLETGRPFSPVDLDSLLHDLLRRCGCGHITASWDSLLLDCNDVAAMASLPTWSRHVSGCHHTDCDTVRSVVETLRSNWPAGTMIPVLVSPVPPPPSTNEDTSVVALRTPYASPLAISTPATLLVVPQWALEALHDDTTSQLTDAVVAQVPIFPISFVSLRKGDLRMDVVCLVNHTSLHFESVKSVLDVQFLVDALLHQATATYAHLYEMLRRGVQMSQHTTLQVANEWTIPLGTLSIVVEAQHFASNPAMLTTVRDCVLRASQQIQAPHPSFFELWTVSSASETGAFVQRLVHRIALEPHATFVDEGLMEAWVGSLLTPGP